MKDFFYNSASLLINSQSYVKRAEDELLITNIKAKKLSCVYSSILMGKTSLIRRTSESLKEDGFLCIEIDAGAFMTPLEENWYYTIFDKICSDLNLKKDLAKWWNGKKDKPASVKFIDFIKEWLLPENKEVIIFIDKVDTCIRLIKTEQLFYYRDFFDTIRYFYQERCNVKEFFRINYALFGEIELFNTFVRTEQLQFPEINVIHLKNINLEELLTVFSGGFDIDSSVVKSLLKRVYDWTKGHPFLTQTLCLEISNKIDLNEIDKPNIETVNSVVDKTKDELFFDVNCNHLKYLEDQLLNHQSSVGLIEFYANVHENRNKIAYDEQNDLISSLILLGLIVEKGGFLDISNEIYYNYFCEEWYDKYFRKQCPFGDKVKKWKNKNRKSKYLLIGKELDFALKWKKQFFIQTTKLQDEFLEACFENITKRRLKKLSKLLISIIVLFTILLGLSYISYTKQMVKIQKLESQIDTLAKDTTALREENRKLLKIKDSLDNEIIHLKDSFKKLEIIRSEDLNNYLEKIDSLKEIQSKIDTQNKLLKEKEKEIESKNKEIEDLKSIVKSISKINDENAKKMQDQKVRIDKNEEVISLVSKSSFLIKYKYMNKNENEYYVILDERGIHESEWLQNIEVCYSVDNKIASGGTTATYLSLCKDDGSIVMPDKKIMVYNYQVVDEKIKLPKLEKGRYYFLVKHQENAIFKKYFRIN